MSQYDELELVKTRSANEFENKSHYSEYPRIVESYWNIPKMSKINFIDKNNYSQPNYTDFFSEKTLAWSILSGIGKSTSPIIKIDKLLHDISISIHESTYYKSFDELVKESEYFLYDDWDDEGAFAIDRNLFRVATSFLKRYIAYIIQEKKTFIKLPEINPCRDGSVDLEWNCQNAQLLLNIHHNPETIYVVSYYGNKSDKNEIKGRIVIDNENIEDYLALWMTTNLV